MDPWQQIELEKAEQREKQASDELNTLRERIRGCGHDERLGSALRRIMLATATLQLQAGRDDDWQIEITSHGIKSVGGQDYDWAWNNIFGVVVGNTVEHFEALADKLEAQL